MDKLKQWMYYFIIGLISLISLFFLPMLGTEIGLSWNIPNTTVGWIVWVVTKVIVAVINILIFHCFMCQAKVNIKDDSNYKKARDILIHQKVKEVQPKSPRRWNVEQYGKKGIAIFLASALSTVALTQALLTFDWVSMLTYLFTIIMGLVFGILQMKTAEEYWTGEYLEYALLRQEQDMEKTIENPAILQQEEVANTDTLDNTGICHNLQNSASYDPISEGNSNDNN